MNNEYKLAVVLLSLFSGTTRNTGFSDFRTSSYINSPKFNMKLDLFQIYDSR